MFTRDMVRMLPQDVGQKIRLSLGIAECSTTRNSASLQRGCCKTNVGRPSLRTAISRSYYGAFGVARRLLEPHIRFSTKDGSSHKEVQRAFSNCQSAMFKEMGRKLDELRIIRNDADYDADSSHVDDWKQARLEEGKAAKLIRELKDAFSSQNEANTLKEIRDGSRGILTLK